ncbi:hypothetical protein QFZ94_000215 [Paraburkholderia sp. JPY465]
MPGAAGLGPHRFGTLSESSAELVAPATDRFICDHNATLKQQLLDVSRRLRLIRKYQRTAQLMTIAGKRWP